MFDDFALRNVNISHAMQIIDIGCGFGFFTQSLKGKISERSGRLGDRLFC